MVQIGNNGNQWFPIDAAVEGGACNFASSPSAGAPQSRPDLVYTELYCAF